MHDVISAFLDNEPFDAQELTASLATPEGRELLIDLVAMRSVVQPAETVSSRGVRQRSRWLWTASAAAVLLAMVGGYQYGRLQGDASAAQATESSVAAPEPTTVLKFEPGVNWTELPQTGRN